MKKHIEMTESDILAHALLRMPDGPDFEQAVTNIRAFLQGNGETGYSAMCSSLRGMLYQVFRREAEALCDEKLSRTLLIANRFDDMWVDLLGCAACGGFPAVEDHLRIAQYMEFLDSAKTEAEIDSHLDGLREVLLRPDKTFLAAGKWQVELHLTELLVDTLEKMPDLSMETIRDIALYHFLGEDYPIDQELWLISSFKGELFLLTPENIHKLNGKHDGKFLKREVDRLARELPLVEFLHLLSAMNNVEHPTNSVADGVLNSLCMEYQAMLGPVA